MRPNPALPFGSAPNALALTPDGKTLYVASGTNNCVAVVRLSARASGVESAPKSTKIAGSIPTAWYPGALLLDSERNMLYVANVKGVGSLTQPEDAKGHNSHHHRGSVSMIPLPTEKELPALTERVNRNNRLQWSLTGLNPGREKASDKPVPVPLFEGEKSVFKHVIYIKTLLLVCVTHGIIAVLLAPEDGDVVPLNHACKTEFAFVVVIVIVLRNAPYFLG